MILLPWLFAAHAQALELGASIIWEQNLHLWRWVEVPPCSRASAWWGLMPRELAMHGARVRGLVATCMGLIG